MDGLSTSASVVAIIQLAETLKHLYDFFRFVQDAPRSIRSLVAELQVLLAILNHAVAEVQYNPFELSIMTLLQSCSDQAIEILQRVELLNRGLSSRNLAHQKWTAIKVVLHGAKLERLTDSLERLKTTLIMAQSFHQRYVTKS